MKRIKIKRRYIVLFVSILLPLIAAFLVGSYGYNSEKFGQGSWKKEYATQYFTSDDKENPTTENLIDKYMKYGINNQYHIYDKDPIYDMEIKDENGKKLFDLLVYQAVYKFRVDDEPVDRMQYIFFYYNIQYNNIRNLFEADENLRNEINSKNVPTFSARIKEKLSEEIEDYDPLDRGITQIPEEQLSIRDRGSDVTFKSGRVANDGEEIPDGEILVKAFIGFVPFRDIPKGNTFTIEIDAIINAILDDTGQSLKTQIAKFELNLSPSPDDVDQKDFVESYQQDLVKAGYFWWAFKNYLWWISLIAFLAIGVITGSFYLVYVAEEKKALEEALRAKKRKR